MLYENLLSGMKFLMDGFEAFVVHVGIDLGGGDVGVAEQFLNYAQIGTIRQ